MWRENLRDNILAWVDPIDCGNGVVVYDIWINPRTGEDVARCPWLRKLPKKNKYTCRIHEAKPKVCREFPKTEEQAKEKGCKRFDSLTTPGQGIEKEGLNLVDLWSKIELGEIE